MTRQQLLGRGALVVWLAVMWLLLWGELTIPNLINGLLLGLILAVVVPPPGLGDDEVTVHPLPALSFLLWFGWALVVSNLTVAKEVLAPPGRTGIRPAIVAVPLRTRSGRLATLIANAITLTPGTMTVDARGRPAVLYVHVMSFSDVESTLEEMADLERRIVDAFGTAEERALICGRPASAGPGEEEVVHP